MVLAYIVACLTTASPPPGLLEARGKIDNLDYAAALKALDRALETEGLEREVVLEIYELKGVSFAVLGKADKAREAFRALLALDPKRRLSGAQPPRVTSAFFEALGRAAAEGTLALQPSLEEEGGQFRAVVVTVPVNPLKLAKKLSLHATVNGMPREVEVALSGEAKSARLEINAPRFTWWVEARGERGAQLVALGSAELPNVVEAPPKPPPDVPVATALVPQEAEPAAPRGAPLRVAGAVVGVAGVGALAVGVGIGAASADARRRVDEAEVDAEGYVTGMTQREAALLDRQARDQAAVANVLMIGGALIAATGLVLVLFAPSDEVAVAPAPGGAVVSGRF